jgi:uncharacterized C2H2 Zn-finger protein
MSDFVKFCPKCYLCFRDPDLFTQHVAKCDGTVPKKDTKPVQTAQKSSAANVENVQHTAKSAPPDDVKATSNVAKTSEPPDEATEDDPPVVQKQPAKGKASKFQS